MTLQQLKEEANKALKIKLGSLDIRQLALKKDGSGRYDYEINATEIKDFIDSLITKAYEQGRQCKYKYEKKI